MQSGSSSVEKQLRADVESEAGGMSEGSREEFYRRGAGGAQRIL
jgi:hypothetical protein